MPLLNSEKVPRNSSIIFKAVNIDNSCQVILNEVKSLKEEHLKLDQPKQLFISNDLIEIEIFIEMKHLITADFEDIKIGDDLESLDYIRPNEGKYRICH